MDGNPYSPGEGSLEGTAPGEPMAVTEAPHTEPFPPPPNGSETGPTPAGGPESSAPQPEFPSSPPGRIETPPAPARKRRRGLVIALVAAAVIVAVVVAAVALTGGGTSAPPKGGASSTAAFAVPSVSATADSAVQVDVRWQAASGNVSQYVVFRNGTTLATEPSTILSYTDTNVQPGHTYTYGVEASQPSGHTSAVATTSVTTPAPPPLSQARLNGTASITSKILQVSGLVDTHVGQIRRLGWDLHVRCDTGPCTVGINLFAPGQHPQPAILARSGANYHGHATARFIKCGSSTITATLTVALHVTRARYIAGVWQAVGIAGTLKVFAPGTFSCTTASSTEAITGTISS